MRAFAQSDRFVSEVEARKLRPAYVFVGDEVFFRKRCREAILQHLVPPELRDFSLFEFDLAETDTTDPQSDEIFGLTGFVTITRKSNGKQNEYPPFSLAVDGNRWPDVPD